MFFFAAAKKKEKRGMTAELSFPSRKTYCNRSPLPFAE
jgi:hypothetical protein